MSMTQREKPSTTEGGRLLVCIFHMNLAFSSLPLESQAEVIERCYWPMLRLPEHTSFPIAVEATGYTLERIQALDPNWMVKARELIKAGQLELVGSGYAQCVGPLLPAEVNRWNLRLGLDAYAELLAAKPRVALVSEQAYSPGLVPLYLEAGYDAIVVDWDNAFRSHPEWGPGTRRYPQCALGGGSRVPVVWSESIAFQKFQRFAHGEMSLVEYLRFVTQATSEGGALLLYANDAEVFDHRPGRFKAEPEALGGEWDRIAEALAALEAADCSPALPSDVLRLLDRPGAGREVRLESPTQPIPTKKQNKYNVSRWAVSGRDDIGINTRCWRLYERMRARSEADPRAWRELCSLWASDFRTHITDARWIEFRRALERAEARYGAGTPVPERLPRLRPARREERLLHLAAGDLEVVLNVRRGLAVASFRDLSVSDRSLCGTVEHGYFPTIELGADWYTGNLVQEAPLRHKVTDLEWTSHRVVEDGERIVVLGRLETELGEIEKTVIVDPEVGGVELEWVLRWSELPHGSLRAGHVTLRPESFERATLWYAAHNGGIEAERHDLGMEAFDHGGAVSAQVSARQGLGLTEGVLMLGDSSHAVRIEVDQSVAKPLGLITYQPAGDRFFLSASLSLTESDETRRGGIPRPPEEPQRLRIRLSASRMTSLEWRTRNPFDRPGREAVRCPATDGMTSQE